MRACIRCGRERSERQFRVYRHTVGDRVYISIRSECYDCEKDYARAYHHRRQERDEAETSSIIA